MGKFILNRLLLIFPTMGVISLLAFFIGANSPLDPVEAAYQNILNGRSMQQVQREIDKIAAEQYLDRPLFYFSINSCTGPDTLHRIVFRKERKTAERLYHRYGHWEGIEKYRLALKAMQARIESSHFREIKQVAAQLYLNEDLSEAFISSGLRRIGEVLENEDPDPEAHSREEIAIKSLRDEAERQIKDLLAQKPEWRSYLPIFKWHGLDNRYHHWLKAALRLDFGKSIVTGQQVGKDWDRFVGMSLRFTLLSALIGYALAICLGVWMATHAEKRSQKLLNGLLIGIDSIPSFWMATLFLLFLANPHYCNCFPATYQPDHFDLRVELRSMLMPLMTYVLGMLVVLTRLMKSSMQAVWEKDFIRTARAKGLPLSKVIWKHALRNALIPMIATLASILVWLLSGSVIVERIFSIPGLGDKILLGLESGDIPVIMMVFTLGGLFMALGYLLTDLLYMWADPRIRMGGKDG